MIIHSTGINKWGALTIVTFCLASLASGQETSLSFSKAEQGSQDQQSTFSRLSEPNGKQTNIISGFVALHKTFISAKNTRFNATVIVANQTSTTPRNISELQPKFGPDNVTQTGRISATSLDQQVYALITISPPQATDSNSTQPAAKMHINFESVPQQNNVTIGAFLKRAPDASITDQMIAANRSGNDAIITSSSTIATVTLTSVSGYRSASKQSEAPASLITKVASSTATSTLAPMATSGRSPYETLVSVAPEATVEEKALVFRRSVSPMTNVTTTTTTQAPVSTTQLSWTSLRYKTDSIEDER